MNSMTGYGYKEETTDNIQVSCEIKSVNSRFLDLSVSLPPYMNAYESAVRKIINGRVARGKVDVFIRVKSGGVFQSVSVDSNLARMYLDAIQNLSLFLGYEDAGRRVPLEEIVGREGVLSVSNEYDAGDIWDKTKDVLESALEDFLSAREKEGEAIKANLLLKLDILDGCAAAFGEYQDEMEARFRTGVTKKFTELLANKVDENRIMNEVAAMVVRYTVNEEVVRLKSHLAAMRREITEGTAPGKKLDFICQEAGREINTIGSKNQLLEVADLVITAKGALEDIREQCRNVE